MSSELLDFTGRKDFEFLKFGNARNLTQDDIKVFKEDCMRINNTNNQMVLEQCKLGLLLSELKECGTWKSVINPESGFAFMIHSFEAFCKYAFRFSKTKAYGLMQVSKLVTSNSEDEVFFINEKYKDFGISQLTELASVPAGKRNYFTPDMTIDEMQAIKKYIASEEFWYDKQKKDFDLLTYANNYVERKKKPKELPVSNPDVMDGQMSLFPEDNDDGAGEIFPTSGKIDDGEDIDEYEEDENSPEHQEFLKACEPWIELTEEKREKAIKIALIERAGTIRKQRIYEKYKQNPLHGEFVNFVKEEYGNSGWGVVGLNAACDYKGYRITPYRGDWVIFMTWSQVASRIVGLINTREYLSKDSDDGESEIFPTSGKNEPGEVSEADDQSEVPASMSEDYIEKARQAAHAAGLPFYEGGAGEISPISGKIDDGEEIDEVERLAEEIEKNAREGCILIGYGEDMEPAEGEVWQGGGLDHDVDEYDEADETQEDIRGEMETIEADAEKSVSEKKYQFTTRDEIRYFLEDYKNWKFRDDFRTPFTKIGYRYTLKTFDIINVLEVEGITNENLVSGAEGLDGPMPLYFLHRAKYKDQPSIMVGKRQLENYLMHKRDELQGV